jgi:hypothetical protein
MIACAALTVWVQRRALGGFFALDDLVIMEEVVGLREAVPRLWRLISRTLFFGAAVPLFAPNALPYHVVSLALHVLNVVLIYRFVSGRARSGAAALVAASLFGASRLHFSALGSVATIGEPLALAFTLGAFLLHERGGTARRIALLLFACAVLSKESVVLLPAVLLLPGADGASFRERLRHATPMLVLSALFAIALVVSSVGGAHLGGEAYARAYGGNLFANLMTYTRWVVDPRDAFPGQVSAIDPRAVPVGALATVVLLALAWVARRAALPPAFGALWWLLALLPVLPLVHHSYLYYLYVPLAGLAMVLGGVVGWVERLAAGRAHRGTPIGVHLVRVAAVVIVIAHAARADDMLDVRYTTRMRGTGIPLDPDLRKSEIARHAFTAVGKKLGGSHGKVAFLLPSSVRTIYSTATGERMAVAVPDSGSYSMLAGALDDGRGLRALIPGVDSAAFLSAWKPGYADFEIFSQSNTGQCFALGRGADGFAEAGAALMRSGDVVPARELLADALGEFPDHAPLRYQYARTFYATGDSAAMRRELGELLRRAPGHPLAERVRDSGVASAP